MWKWKWDWIAWFFFFWLPGLEFQLHLKVEKKHKNLLMKSFCVSFSWLQNKEFEIILSKFKKTEKGLKIQIRLKK